MKATLEENPAKSLSVAEVSSSTVLIYRRPQKRLRDPAEGANAIAACRGDEMRDRANAE